MDASDADDHADLRAFVVEAHRNGYASAEAVVDDDGTKRIEYERGPWRYVDRYVGARDFLGAEVVSRDGDPVWGMHYDGRLTDDGADADAVYDFLREALARASSASPFRGPDFEREPFAYENDSSGTIARFEGTEAISCDGVRVYAGHYRGGLVE